MCKQMNVAQFHNYEKIRQLIKRALQAFFTFLAHNYFSKKFSNNSSSTQVEQGAPPPPQILGALSFFVTLHYLGKDQIHVVVFFS